MKTPVVLVTVALTLAILLAATLLIATGTRGENALRPMTAGPTGRILTPAK
jgi:aldose sugar dehydrogenase